jgi:hypothetical protein
VRALLGEWRVKRHKAAFVRDVPFTRNILTFVVLYLKFCTESFMIASSRVSTLQHY